MTGPQIVTYAVVNTIYIPCVATIAVLGRELGWRWTGAASRRARSCWRWSSAASSRALVPLLGA